VVEETKEREKEEGKAKDVEEGDKKVYGEMATTISSNTAENTPDNPRAVHFKLPYYAQFSILLSRAIVLTTRSSWTASTSIIETLFIAVIVGLCWWDTRLTEKSVVDSTGFLSFASTFWFFSTLYLGLMEFFPERLVVQKERDAGSYQLSAFFLSKTIANLPIRVCLPVLFIIISYPLVFHQTFDVAAFFSILGIVVLVAQAGESIGEAIGAMTSSMEIAMSTATTVSLSMLIFGGFYTQNVPSFLAWLSSLSALKYAFDASVQVLISSHGDIKCNGGNEIPACYGQDSVSSAYVLDWLDVTTNSIGMNVLYLLLMAIGFRVLAYVFLRFIVHRSARGY
jgi:hypothetical protein